MDKMFDKVVVIDNNTILDMLKETKKERYRYLYIVQYISSDFDSDGEASIINALKFYKGNHIAEFSSCEKGILYDLNEIILL